MACFNSLRVCFLKYIVTGNIARFPNSLSKTFKRLAFLKLCLHFFIVAGLRAIHNVGIIFRDIKLQNILVGNSGNLVITDFGLAKWLSRRQRTYTICGTLAFMAPEVARGQAYDHSVDLWSLGILLYCMAFAQYPFPPTTNHQELQEVQTETKLNLQHSNSDLQGLLENLLQVQDQFRIFTLNENNNSKSVFLDSLKDDHQY